MCRPGYYLLMSLLWLQGCLTLFGFGAFVVALPYWYGCGFDSRAHPWTVQLVRCCEGWFPPMRPLLLLWTGGLALLLLSQSLKHPFHESPTEPPLSLPLTLSILCSFAWLLIGAIFLPSFFQLLADS